MIQTLLRVRVGPLDEVPDFVDVVLLLVDERLLLVDEDGDLALAQATRGGLDVLGQAPILTDNAWTPPTLVGNRLYLRDRREVVALDVGQ